MEEFVPQFLNRKAQKAVKLKLYSDKPKPSVRMATIAARTTLAVTLLLTLVAGSIVLPATAAGPACSLACCAGRAPHAAGSCMHGSCQAGMAAANPASDKTQNAHQPHQHQQVHQSETYDPSQPLSGAMASVGSEMAEIPTIEAAPYEAPYETTAETSNTPDKPPRSSISVAALAKPCQPDCGLCISGFLKPKRSRNSAIPAGSNHHRPTLSARLANAEAFLEPAGAAHGFKCAPRGPPLSFS